LQFGKALGELITIDENRLALTDGVKQQEIIIIKVC
jgi:hypothetical protein